MSEEEIKHYDVSPAARSAAQKLMTQLNAEDSEKQAEAAGTMEHQDAEGTVDEGQDAVDESDNALAKEVKDEAPVSEGKDGQDTESPEEEGKEADGSEKGDKKLSEEEAMIREQEKLLADDGFPGTDPKQDAKARRAWQLQRLQLRQIKEENERLKMQPPAPLAPPVNFTEADAAAAISKLDDDWQNGRLDIDYAALEEKKAAIRTSQVVMQLYAEQSKQAQQQAMRQKIDRAIEKAEEQGLPGMRKAWDALLADPLLANDFLIGQIVTKNIDNGSGTALAYYLGNHIAESRKLVTEMDPGERAVRLHEIRTRLTKARKPAEGSGYRPSKPITNSYIEEKPRRGNESDPVKAEIKRHLDRVYHR